MANTIISTNTVTATGDTVGSLDEFLVFDGVTYVNTSSGDGISITGNSPDLIFNGDYAYLGNQDAIRQTGFNGALITIAPTGSITTTGVAEVVFLTGDNNRINNDGFLSGAAVTVTGDNNTLVNAGSIRGTSSAFTTVFLSGADNRFENSGSVSGDVGVQLGDGGYMYNSGEIISNGISLRAAGDTFELVNYGMISSALGVSLQANTSTATTITNGGTMSGSIVFRTLADSYTAVGDAMVVGNISGFEGADVFDLRAGTVTGFVDGGEDDDTYLVGDDAPLLVEGAGEGTDEVQATSGYALGANFENLTLIGFDDNRGVGNAENNLLTGNAGSNRLGGAAGADTLEGGAGDDSLYGGGGNDSLVGGDGDDLLSAGSSADRLFGGDGDDVLLGRRGVDFLNGGDGADLLEGGTGNDQLLGGRDNDTLIGGAGSDEMNGGSGNDTFVFENAGDSPNTGGRDLIIGFEVGLDRIDVSAINSDTMEVNIGGALSGAGTPSLRTFETGGGDTRVFIDSDGDNSVDMRIDVIGVISLTGIDFLI